MRMLIGEQTFRSYFQEKGKETVFSDKGLESLYHYLLEQEVAGNIGDGRGQIKLDVDFLCNYFKEYQSDEEIMQNYTSLQVCPWRDWAKYFAHYIPIPDTFRTIIAEKEAQS